MNSILFANRSETAATRKVVFYGTFFESRIIYTILGGRKESFYTFCAIDTYPCS